SRGARRRHAHRHRDAWQWPAVVPYEDEEGLTKPKAYVVLKEGEKAEGKYDLLKEHVKEQIGKWKYPREIVFVEGLPKTATGKIQRFKLREGSE
ncbi:MAG: hypothetical protein P8X52_07770, partial [Limibacillus sp.]